MNILVCSRVSIPAKDRTLPAWEYLRSLGHDVRVEHPYTDRLPGGWRPDVIISMGVTIMDETECAARKWPQAALFCYNWDTYAWVWDNPRPGEYDYKRYGQLLKRATEVWVPSECTGRRCDQWWGVSNWHVVLSACPWWEYPCPACDGDGSTIGGPCAACGGSGDGVGDDGYVLCTLREIPDPCWGWLERQCARVGVPLRMTRHEVTYEAYQAAVARCRLLVSPLYELSTGGLTLTEGYYHGKPCLLSDSPWHGGRDYMRNMPGVTYFDHTDEDSLGTALRRLYDNPPRLDRMECRRWVAANYSDERMIDDMLRRMKCHVRG